MTRKQKERFMQEAIKEAKEVSLFKEIPVGAVIVHEGRIIARAHNEVQKLKDATAHAEIIAITQASSYLRDFRLKGCSLFVTLEPCLMCTGAIKLSRLSHIYFGAYDSKEGALISTYDFLAKGARTKTSFKVEGGVLKEECGSLLKEFFSNLRNKEV
jgi:tRNA(adenine34) deaminase